LTGFPASSPTATNFITPVPVQIRAVDSGLMMGEAIATPTDKANQTSTSRPLKYPMREGNLSPHGFDFLDFLFAS
jgi:hypothetical protein